MKVPKKLFTLPWGEEIWSKVRPKRNPIVPAASGGIDFPLALKRVRLSRHGCTNRPFFHIIVQMSRRHQHDFPIEQIGTYDPLPNEYNEKLCSINVERLRYWLAHRTECSKSVARLLGLAGILPMQHDIIQRAWQKRRKLLSLHEEAQRLKEEAAKTKSTEEEEAASA